MLEWNYTMLAKRHLMKVSLIVKLAGGLGNGKTGSTTSRRLFANPSLLITTLFHKNQSHPVHSNQLSGVDCGANRPFLKLNPVQVQISILKLCILRALQLRNPNLERICSSEQVLGECHGKDSLSLCWVTPTSSSFFYQ